MKTSMTVKQIMALGPCEDYPAWRVRRLFGRRDRIGVLDIARMRIPVWDKLWSISHFFTLKECQTICKGIVRNVHLMGLWNRGEELWRAWDGLMRGVGWVDVSGNGPQILRAAVKFVETSKKA